MNKDPAKLSQRMGDELDAKIETVGKQIKDFEEFFRQLHDLCVDERNKHEMQRCGWLLKDTLKAHKQREKLWSLTKTLLCDPEFRQRRELSHLKKEAMENATDIIRSLP